MTSSVKEVEGAHADRYGWLVGKGAEKLADPYKVGCDGLVFCDRRSRRDTFCGLSGSSLGRMLLPLSNTIFKAQNRAKITPAMETARIRCGLVICPRQVFGPASLGLLYVTRLKVEIVLRFELDPGLSAQTKASRASMVFGGSIYVFNSEMSERLCAAA
jgi:hypothetical protein